MEKRTPVETLRTVVALGAIGDALGRPVEFLSDPAHKSEVVDALLAGTDSLVVTDDTQLSLALASEFRASGASEEAVARAFSSYFRDPRSHEPQRFPGGAVMRAAEAIARTGAFVDPTGDQLGSGALMRTGVFAAVGARDLAITTGCWSHNHPFSPACTAWVYDLCVDGRVDLDGDIGEILATQEWNGFSAPGVIADIHRVMSERPRGEAARDTLRRAALIGRDSDTVACIVGCALGLREGWDASCDDLWERVEADYRAEIEALR